ncbi:nitrogen assimilation response regulator NtrX [Hirschia baltica]|uniref:Two component, sigma54 specific, transcriptional regulator, Fis family n=1 Tax=Hirschia baltica (strain ATCC 49814 / DSM 5838 / IFAM 1418) TaxID=582402 RepID=C6XJQ3_HIRBI|nr:sigma-54 dependent transcriptional regulator [Hirschia baltica]ACT59348.1 two component, sigma54 specific, transcriptional regulator, Fis family [Hirschia baltica ATCC 49814]
MAFEILVVDDETDIRELVGGILEDEGYKVRTAADAKQSMDAVRERAPNLVLLDVWLKGSEFDGLEILSMLKELDPNMPIIIMSGHGTVETAVTAIRNGAYDYLEKPFNSDKLLVLVQRALEAAQLRRENTRLKSQTAISDQLIGDSQATQQLRAAIAKVSPANSRVLISGPPGVGKELVARMIHANSSRNDGPFVVVNAATIAPERMEMELFGEEDQTGRPRKIGLFEQAHNGTLLLDEVADMPAGTQSKILRVLIDQRFKRENGNSDVKVDVRVISSTARNLQDEISVGRFREDLYYRLSVVPINVPSLESRREDIADLAVFFAKRIGESSGLPARSFSEEALAVLQSSEWPGNVRQLRNVVERILILAGGDSSQQIMPDHLPIDRSGDGSNTASMDTISLPLREAREKFEREYLTLQITRFGGNISRTAAFIGMERSALHRKLKALGVDTSSEKL